MADLRLLHKADIALINIRFRRQSGHWVKGLECLLLTQSGHERFRIAAVQTDS